MRWRAGCWRMCAPTGVYGKNRACVLGEVRVLETFGGVSSEQAASACAGACRSGFVLGVACVYGVLVETQGGVGACCQWRLPERKPSRATPTSKKHKESHNLLLASMFFVPTGALIPHRTTLNTQILLIRVSMADDFLPCCDSPPFNTTSRIQVAGSPSLGEELLRALHSTDDPATLTELLRLFSTTALMTSTASTAERAIPATVDESDNDPSSRRSNSPGQTAVLTAAAGRKEGSAAAMNKESAAAINEGNAAVAAAAAAVTDKDNRGQGESTISQEKCGSSDAGAAPPEGEDVSLLVSGMVARDTLEKLGFFLENALEERLLAWVRRRNRSCLFPPSSCLVPLVCCGGWGLALQLSCVRTPCPIRFAGSSRDDESSIVLRRSLSQRSSLCRSARILTLTSSLSCVAVRWPGIMGLPRSVFKSVITRGGFGSSRPLMASLFRLPLRLSGGVDDTGTVLSSGVLPQRA